MTKEDTRPRVTPEMLARLGPEATVTYEDDVLVDTDEAVWNVTVDGETVAEFVVGEDDFGDAESDAQHLVLLLREHVERVAALTRTVESVRAFADWLEAHPELPVPRVNPYWYFFDHEARRKMEVVARALGEQAEESVEVRTSSGDVNISGSFGSIEVKATAAAHWLGGRIVEPVAPAIDYEPILGKVAVI